MFYKGPQRMSSSSSNSFSTSDSPSISIAPSITLHQERENMLREVQNGNFTKFHAYLTKENLTEWNENGAGLRRLKDTQLKMILKSIQGTDITSINLCGNGIGACLNIVKQEHLGTKLESIYLSCNGIEDAEAVNFVSGLKKEVHTLLLGQNRISKRGAIEIFRKAKSTGLRILDLGYNDIKFDESDIDELRESLKDTGLTEIILSGNAGGEYLVEAARGTQLKKITLNNCNLDCYRANAIAESLPFTQLEEIDLSYNLIEGKGATALANAVTNSSLKKLDLHNNRVDEKGVQNFLRIVKDTQLSSFKIGRNQTTAEFLKSLPDLLRETNLIEFSCEYDYLPEEGSALKAALLFNKDKKALNKELARFSDLSFATQQIADLDSDPRFSTRKSSI